MALVCKGLVKVYNGRRVVNGVDLEVHQGEVVGLLGPNGAGKTTTFYMIVGMIRPDEGEVFLDGEEISSLPMYKRARKGVGYLSQESSVFRKMTVEENVLAILETLPLSKQKRYKRAKHLLEELNIAHLSPQKAYTLSGGERRRTEITRALATHPKYLLLDEPFSGIDPKTVEDLQGIVATLKAKDLGVLITDHNVRETLEIIDRAAIIFDGKILKAGTAEFLANDPETRRLYLGERFRLA
jgi:lipopolysaccharide export system ATP-binding protein